jgi:transcriptional regulator with XRE-family HTH domain
MMSIANENISSRIARPAFLRWRLRLGLSRRQAAELLGRTPRQLFNYEQGGELPQTLLLAMVALEYLPPWRLAELDIVPTWRKPR